LKLPVRNSPMKGEQRQSTLEESYESLMVREIYGSLLQKNKRERAMKNSAQIKKKVKQDILLKIHVLLSFHLSFIGLI
jgi:hypothetical protein